MALEAQEEENVHKLVELCDTRGKDEHTQNMVEREKKRTTERSVDLYGLGGLISRLM